MVRSCITFSGGRVDQSVAVEVLEALRPLGVQAALDALDRSEHQTDEKRRSIELALERRGMRQTVLNGSTRRRNQRTDLSQGSLRSVGTQHSAMSPT